MTHWAYRSFYQSGICNHRVLKYYHCTILSSDSRTPVKCVRLPHSILHNLAYYFLSFFGLCATSDLALVQ